MQRHLPLPAAASSADCPLLCAQQCSAALRRCHSIQAKINDLRLASSRSPSLSPTKQRPGAPAQAACHPGDVPDAAPDVLIGEPSHGACHGDNPLIGKTRCTPRMDRPVLHMHGPAMVCAWPGCPKWSCSWRPCMMRMINDDGMQNWALACAGGGFQIPAIQLAPQGQQSGVSLRSAAEAAALAEPQRALQGGSPRRATASCLEPLLEPGKDSLA